MAEQEGLEPPTPYGAAAFKAVSSSSQVYSTYDGLADTCYSTLGLC